MHAKKQFSEVMSTCSIISAVLVVFIHTYNIGLYRNVSNSMIYWVEEFISQFISRGAVPFFFISSAFFLYSSNKDVSAIYSSRFKSLGIPYLLWNTVYMVIFGILHHLSLTDSGMDEITLGNLFNGIFLHKYNYSYWFMRNLIIFTLLYPLIRLIISRSKVIAISIGVVFAALVMIMPSKESGTESFIYYYLGAIIGFYYSESTEKLVVMSMKKKIILLMVFLAISILSFIATNVYKFELSFIRNLMMVLFLFFAVSTFNIRIKGILCGLSFMIYSLHPIVLEMIEKTIYISMPHTLLWMVIDYLFAPAICIGLIAIICVVWKKVCPWIYKLFNGGRI